MLKKYKILMVMIVLSLVGIGGIVGVWLYGGYIDRREMFVNDVERSLFNAVQSYYEGHQNTINENRSRSIAREGKVFVSRIKDMYANVDEARIKTLWDSLAQERMRRYAERREAKKEDGEPVAIMPSFMLQNIDFNDSTLNEVSILLAKNLEAKGITAPVHLAIKTIAAENRVRGKHRVRVEQDGSILTRPILVSPVDEQYLVGQFEQPIFFLLGKMAAQLVVSIIVILALVGAFIYLLWTINRQNKLALLRKSFVNNMTHELKTPVATVMAAIESVQRYGAKDDRSKMERYLNISHRELQHLSNMIEKVLQLDIDEVNGIAMQKTNVDLPQMLQQEAEMAQIGAKKTVTIDFVDDVKELLISADSAHLKNVVSNLLDNAIKYSGESVNIKIGLRKEESNVLVTVSDNGQGIDVVYLKDIFDMFFRVPSGNLHPVKGFGLGLAYVKQVMKQHNGAVHVDSILGKGTTFTLSIPII